ncbi:D-glycero-beta-D-manno-heptose 1,7-bisphosphate 7-phosphatase [soil metagenome]
MKAVFLDREGTLIVEPYDQVLDSVEKVYLINDTIEALRKIAELDYTVFLIINENGLAQQRVSQEQFQSVNARLLELLAPSGIKIEKIYYCPHPPAEGCGCRKPRPGMIKKAMEEYPIEISESWVIGDKLQHAGLGKAVGAQTILIDRDGRYGEGTADYIVSSLGEAAQVIASPVSNQY